MSHAPERPLDDTPNKARRLLLLRHPAIRFPPPE
jgi:hypothetical protein